MANPRYPEPQQRERPSKLAAVMPFLALQQQQQSLDDSAQRQKLATMLQLMGLQQDQAKQTQQAGESDAHLRFLREQLGATTQDNQAERAIQSTHNDLTRQGLQQTGQLADQTHQEHLANESGMRQRAMMDFAGRQPQMDPNIMMNYLNSIDPQFQTATNQAHQTHVKGQASALFPAFQAAQAKHMTLPGIPDEVMQAMQGMLPRPSPLPGTDITTPSRDSLMNRPQVQPQQPQAPSQPSGGFNPLRWLFTDQSSGQMSPQAQSIVGDPTQPPKNDALNNFILNLFSRPKTQQP